MIFLDILIDQKYHSVEVVEERGEFSSRGGIIDFFSPLPAKIQFDWSYSVIK